MRLYEPFVSTAKNCIIKGTVSQMTSTQLSGGPITFFGDRLRLGFLGDRFLGLGILGVKYE